MEFFGFELKKKAEKQTPEPQRQAVGMDISDVSGYMGLFSPHTMGDNFVEVFETMGEVYYPIRFIVDRISGGNFLVKKMKDDSIVWDNDEMNHFLTTPNPLFSFSELTQALFIYKYINGNSYFQAAVPDSFAKTKEIWKWCDSYWTLPSNKVVIDTPYKIPLFTSSKLEDLIKSYRLSAGTSMMNFSPSSILHDRDINLRMGNSYLMGRSRLTSQKYPIANLAAVYEARNVIYVKRGALGMLISKKYDATGSLPLEKKEKDRILKEWTDNYGLDSAKSQISIVDVPTEFVRINMSIQELQPFEETLADACQIAGIFGVPSVLIPRKDMAKYENQNIAEISVYDNVIIPEAKKYVQSLTRFLGLDKSGLYLDVDFSHVNVLQQRDKGRAETKKIISEKCKQEFSNGLITLNDWRSQIGENMVDDPLYSKLIPHMTDEDMEKINRLVKSGQAKEAKPL